MRGHHPPAGQGGEQTTHCRLQYPRVIAQVGGLSERFVDNGVKRDDTPDEVAPNPPRFRLVGPGKRECSGKPSADFGRNRSELGGQPAPRATEIGPGEYDARADDADADLAGAADGEHENLSVRTASRAELTARNDRSRKAGERRRVGREVAQQRGQEAARGAPERQAKEKTNALLREARGQQHDRHRADCSADHEEPALAQ